MVRARETVSYTHLDVYKRQLLRVRDLTATVTTRREVIQAVRGISFDINADEAVGFVGESGCGKSVTAKALMRLAPEGASIGLGGSVAFWGQDLPGLGEDEMRDLRGRRIAMVFQDPMTCLLYTSRCV